MEEHKKQHLKDIGMEDQDIEILVGRDRKLKTTTKDLSVFHKVSGVNLIHSPTKIKEARENFIHTSKQASHAIRAKYKATDILLGEGAFGQVYQFEDRKDPTKKVAVKIMRKELLTETMLEIVRDEISILSLLDHEHIVKHYESFEDPRYMYIVMEVIEDAVQLSEEISERTCAQERTPKLMNSPCFSESELRKIFSMLISACLHIHTNRVTHRDLKPENILLCSKTNSLKIIDFGLSKKHETNRSDDPQMMVGTPHYMSPEIYEKEGEADIYNPPCDMWSLGVTFYTMVENTLPFMGAELQDQIVSEEADFTSKKWKAISEEGKDFIR